MIRFMTRSVLFVFLYVSVSVPPLVAQASTGAQVPRDFAADLERFIETTMAELGVPPGLAIAVVRGDETLYLGGFGYRDVEARLPVEPSTVFYIASSTKSFTGLAAAILEQKGVLDLDTPFVEIVPEARIPGASGGSADESPVTLMDLLTHTAGIENFGIVFRTAYSGQHTSEQLIELIARSEREERVFEYDNIGYVLASLAIDHATGQSWKDVLEEEIFEPLGMQGTTASVSRAQAENWPLASPYTSTPDGFEEIPFAKTDATMHAAGGLLTTVEDLALWLLANLNEGRLGGRQILPAETVERAQRSYTAVDAKFERFHRMGYGLGWYHVEWDGERMLHHFGSFPGFRSHISFLPDRDLGIAVLINEDGHGFLLPDLIARYAYEKLLGRLDVEGRYEAEVAAYAEKMRKDQAEQRAERAERAGRAGRAGGAALTSYVGTYENPDLGVVMIAAGGEGAIITRIGHLCAPLEPGAEPATARVEFLPGMAAGVVGGAAADGHFTRLQIFGQPWSRIDTTGQPARCNQGGDE